MRETVLEQGRQARGKAMLAVDGREVWHRVRAIGIGSKVEYAHRLSYKLHHGTIPAGHMVLHRCDVRACVNPAHLFCGTSQDNVTDMWSKKRGPSKLTEAGVKGIRRACKRMTQRKAAELFKVSESTVSAIVTGRKWRWV